MSERTIIYKPIGSSYKLSTILDIAENAKVANIIGSADYYYIKSTQQDSYNNSFEVYMKEISAGEVFNLYQKMILNSQWDCRDNGNFETIILGREYMFYNIDDKIISTTITNNNNKIEREIKYDITLKTPIEFFTYINELMVSDGITHIYDEGTIIQTKTNNYVKQDLKSKEDVNTLEKMIDRNKCRKFSENHFAIAGFNLITHSINVNYNVPNTISEYIDNSNEDSKKGKKNTISILGDVKDEYIYEMTANSEIPASSIYADEENEHRSDEFLANKLIEELRYVYQGNIIIKFNPDIEIGDTITLFDDITSTFGIFQVDSYEHSLDQRGLITNLIVRASWELKDPILDFHSKDIGYKLIGKLPKKFGLENYEDERKRVHKLMSIYLKTLAQSPKYCTIYKKKQESFINPTTVRCNNILSPTALPLRFFPMFVKGLPQIPSSLEYAFVNIGENSFSPLFGKIYAKLKDSFNTFTTNFISGVEKIIFFVADMFISSVTFNISELLKPLFGMTEKKAKEKTYDKQKDIGRYTASEMVYYNPYDKKYKLMYNNYDYVFGFFNIRLQHRNDLYAENKLLTKNEENDKILLNRKITTVKKMLNDVFDTMFLVELYDGFKITNNGNTYGMNEFLKDCTFSDSVRLEYLNKIMTNSYGSEYGAVITNNSSNYVNVKGTDCKTVELSNGRKAIEVTIDVSQLKINPKLNIEYVNENNYNEKSLKYIVQTDVCIEKIKFIFFHNLYGTKMEDNGESSINERRENVRILLDKYKEFVNSKKIGVVIMADFNLNVYNAFCGENPYKGKGTNTNYIFPLPNDNFISQIKSPTTLNQYGNLRGNQYDNVLISRNLYGSISAKVFEYPEKDKLTISDHVPIYVGIKKTQE